jgi:hypothetical protein
MSTHSWVRANTMAAALLVVSFFFVFYRWEYTSKSDAVAALETISEGIKQGGSQRLKPAVPAAISDMTMAELLSRVQEIATSYNVLVRNVTPNPLNAEQISVGVDGNFRDLMLFLGRLETLPWPRITAPSLRRSICFILPSQARRFPLPITWTQSLPMRLSAILLRSVILSLYPMLAAIWATLAGPIILPAFR